MLHIDYPYNSMTILCFEGAELAKNLFQNVKVNAQKSGGLRLRLGFWSTSSYVDLGLHQALSLAGSSEASHFLA